MERRDALTGLMAAVASTVLPVTIAKADGPMIVLPNGQDMKLLNPPGQARMSTQWFPVSVVGLTGLIMETDPGPIRLAPKRVHPIVARSGDSIECTWTVNLDEAHPGLVRESNGGRRHVARPVDAPESPGPGERRERLDAYLKWRGAA